MSITDSSRCYGKWDISLDNVPFISRRWRWLACSLRQMSQSITAYTLSTLLSGRRILVTHPSLYRKTINGWWKFKRNQCRISLRGRRRRDRDIADLLTGGALDFPREEPLSLVFSLEIPTSVRRDSTAGWWLFAAVCLHNKTTILWPSTLPSSPPPPITNEREQLVECKSSTLRFVHINRATRRDRSNPRNFSSLSVSVSAKSGVYFARGCLSHTFRLWVGGSNQWLK